MGDDAWYNEGLDDAEEEAKRKSNFLPWRFRLQQGESGKFTCVTDLPFSYFEHQFKLNGKWGNFFTCRRKDCPLCRAGNDPTKMYAWVVVDHRTWTDKKGNQHSDEVRLFIAKPKMALRMKKLREKNDGLRGLRIEAERTGGGFSFSTGDQLDADEKYTEDKIRTLKWWPKQKVDKDGKPFGYDWGNITVKEWAEIFAPKSIDELKRVVRAIADEPEVNEPAPLSGDGEKDQEIPWE